MGIRKTSLTAASLLVMITVGSACGRHATATTSPTTKTAARTTTVPAVIAPTTTKPELHEVYEVAALPADFPAKEIPTPTQRLVYTSGESGGLLLRYVSTDAKVDALAYRTVLTAAGYSVTSDAPDVEGPTLAFTFLARNATHHLEVNAINATNGSQYLDVIVDKP